MTSQILQKQLDLKLLLLRNRGILDEVLLKRGRTSPTQVQVHLSSCLSTPIQACEAEENLSANCTECSFNPNVKEEVAKYPNAELARRRVLGLPTR